MSILSSVASGVREAALLARFKTMKHCANNIASALVKSDLINKKNLQNWIGTVLDSWQNDWTKAEIASIMLVATKKAFGDPMALSKEQLKLRQHATQYWNPSGSTINVEPMGLPDENGNCIKYIVSGGLVLIPTPYTLGGKRSTVMSVAPQLRPMPIICESDNLLDITPVSYAEWLMYYPFQRSQCCRYQYMWSDALQVICCGKCRIPVRFSHEHTHQTKTRASA